MCSRFFIVVLPPPPPLLSLSLFSLSTPLPNPPSEEKKKKKSRWEVDNKMLKKRSSVCMKQVLIPPYCRMCVAAAREERLMCFPSPSSRTAELLANHGYCSDIKIILSYLLLQKLVCLVSSVPRYRPSLLVPSLFLLLFFVFLSILWGCFCPFAV